MKIVALVPIKLNSQRLKNKNILPLMNKPLCWHICNTLLKIKKIDEVCVYCSDEKVKEYLPDEITYVKRPKWLDEDRVKGFDIYSEFVKTVDADVYILAHTTSPFIRKETIENALLKVVNGNYDSAFAAEKVQTFAWYKNCPINYDLNDVPRTQDMEPIWVETSAFYIFEKKIFTEHHRRIGYFPYIQEVSGKESIDIDENADYELACKYAEVENKNE